MRKYNILIPDDPYIISVKMKKKERDRKIFHSILDNDCSAVIYFYRSDRIDVLKNNEIISYYNYKFLRWTNPNYITLIINSNKNNAHNQSVNFQYTGSINGFLRGSKTRFDYKIKFDDIASVNVSGELNSLDWEIIKDKYSSLNINEFCQFNKPDLRYITISSDKNIDKVYCR